MLLLTLSCSSFSKKDTGWPWRFPVGEVNGVLRSAWASTQMTQRSGHCWACPPTEPIPRLEKELYQYLLPEGTAVSPVCWAVKFQLPVVASQHDKRVSSPHSSAHGTWQHLVGCTHIARRPDIHVGFVFLNGVKSEVTKVMDRVVWGQMCEISSVSKNNACYLFLTVVRSGAQPLNYARLPRSSPRIHECQRNSYD